MDFKRMIGLLAALALMLAISAAPAIADPGDIGYQDQSFAGTSTPSTPTGTKRNESLLWFNDGSWWAHMWDTTSQDYHIFKLDTATQTWSDTGTLIDPRITSHGDALWDGTHLYVASHVFVNDGVPASSGFESRLYRYSYDTVTDTYTLDAGFPALINNYRTETLVIDKDSTGKLWATWQQDNQIYVSATQGDDQTWGTPFALPVDASIVTLDDTSAVVALGGNKVGVMWSNLAATNDGMWFAVHNDGDPDTAWQPSAQAVAGVRSADDHMNLKALSDGRVIAAIKTEHIDANEPLTQILERNATTGNWTAHTVGIVSECPNRPTVLVDEANDVLHVLQTGPAPPDFVCSTTGGAIYEKTSSLSSISFAPGHGQPVILDADSPAMHNITSTKQNVSPATGLAALAINAATKFYWHHYEQITEPPPSIAPVADFTGTPTDGDAPLTVSFTDASTNNPTNWLWSFGDGTSSTEQSPTHTYARGGTYTVSLTASNANGSNTKTLTNYIVVRDFNVGATPSKRQIVIGQSTTYNIVVSGVNGYAGTVALSVSGVPSGATASLSQSSITLPPTGSSSLAVNTNSTIKNGNYTLTISGTVGSVTRIATVQLQVKKK